MAHTLPDPPNFTAPEGSMHVRGAQSETLAACELTALATATFLAPPQLNLVIKTTCPADADLDVVIPALLDRCGLPPQDAIIRLTRL